MVDYIVERKKLYAGRLIKGSRVSYPVLFKIDEFDFADDLLSDPPKKYQIKEKTSNEDYIGVFVENPFKLEKLLKYLGYGKELTRCDLIDIFENLILDDEWLLNNKELFGWTKHNLGYVDGSCQALPYDLFLDLEDLSRTPQKEQGIEYVKIMK
ncbi:MAG: hypothetical protein IJI22_02445 [Bacilli bacterium]|nr:hypothetical protein [Bacilli bacterium]